MIKKPWPGYDLPMIDDSNILEPYDPLKTRRETMTHQDILQQAITKAIENGWLYPCGANCYEIHKYVEARPEVIAFGTKEDWQEGQNLEGHWSIPELIFNHDFAKALWSENLVEHQETDNDGFTWNFSSVAWQHHLVRMVLADDPIKYLGEHING